MSDRPPHRPRVLLASLSVRTSSKGKSYLSGYLGKASVIAFPGEPDRFGDPTWDLFVSEPEPRDAAQAPARSPPAHDAHPGGPQAARPMYGTPSRSPQASYGERAPARVELDDVFSL